MKNIRKALIIVLAAIMSLYSFSACGGGRSAEGKLFISVENKGYGVPWVRKLAKAFENKTGVEVTVEQSTFEAETTSLQGDSNDHDIIFVCGELSYYATDGRLTNLYELFYNQVPYGADATATKIKDLCAFTDCYNMKSEGDNVYSYYAFPYANGTEALLYNATTLNAIYGSSWKLPKTSNEFFAMLEDIFTNKSDKAYGMTSIGSYTESFVNTWWAQYDGYEKYFDYWRAYKDGEFCSASPEMAKNLGRLRALEALEKLFSRYDKSETESKLKYFHDKITDFVVGSTPGMAQASSDTFAGASYKKDTRLVAFMPNGDWFEYEMDKEVLEGQDIRMMKIPVLSEITETFEGADKNMSDATLSACIAKIDGDTLSTAEEALIAGVSETTFERIREARNMVYSLGCLQQGAVPATSVNKELAAEFLRFMVSDEGQKIYSTELGGLSMCYGYSPDSSINITEYVKSVNAVNKDAKFIYRDISHAICYRGGLAWFTINSNNYTTVMILGSKSAQDVYNYTYNDLSARWETIKKDSGLK